MRSVVISVRFLVAIFGVLGLILTPAFESQGMTFTVLYVLATAVSVAASFTTAE